MTTSPRLSIKIIVADEQAMAEYYKAVYGLQEVYSVAGDNAGTGERFSEVILSFDGAYTSETFVVFRYLDRPAPRDQQSITVWVSDDLSTLCERITRHGGKLVGPTRDLPEHGVRVQFSEDPEGALCENVQLLAPA